MQFSCNVPTLHAYLFSDMVERFLEIFMDDSLYMVKHRIILGHKISSRGIEVDRSKVEVIAKLSEPKSLKDIRSFLRHASFYRRFIKEFNKIARL